jgi:hypothetical protein
MGRSVALDVHLDFCEVALVEDGELRSAGRIATTPERLELFAASLGPDDRGALEATGNAWEIARIIEPHVAEVLVVSPSDSGIRQARAKTDRLDARTLARLLAGGVARCGLDARQGHVDIELRCDGMAVDVTTSTPRARRDPAHRRSTCRCERRG